MSIDKNSKEYKQGLKDGINFTSEHLIDVAHRLRRDVLDLMNMKVQ